MARAPQPQARHDRARRCAWLAAALTLASEARATDAPPRADEAREVARAGPAVMAVFPGVVLHGAGHWSAGRRATAKRLFALELLGLGAMAAGLVTLRVSGASRQLAGPSIATAIFGSALVAGTWFADIYGAASSDDATGEPLTVLPALEASLGYRYVYDPTLAYRSFFVSAVELRIDRVRFRPEGWFGVGHPNERLRVEGAYRFAGPRPMSFEGRAPARAADGSFFDLEIAGVRHSFPPERFAIEAIELAASGRLDLVRVGPTLRGSFLEGKAGWALARHSYEVSGDPQESTTQLLARWAFGLYLGRPSSIGGEVSTFYEHRHDGFAGGLKVPGIGSGPLGSFGARGLAWWTPELGTSAEVRAGSAWVLGASMLFRQPVSP